MEMQGNQKNNFEKKNREEFSDCLYTVSKMVGIGGRINTEISGME